MNNADKCHKNGIVYAQKKVKLICNAEAHKMCGKFLLDFLLKNKTQSTPKIFNGCLLCVYV